MKLIVRNRNVSCFLTRYTFVHWKYQQSTKRRLSFPRVNLRHYIHYPHSSHYSLLSAVFRLLPTEELLRTAQLNERNEATARRSQTMRVVISIAWHAAWHQVTPPIRTSSTEWEALVQLGISQNVQSDSGAHPATHWTNWWVPPSKIKQKGSQADHSPSSSAKGVKWRLQFPSVYACHWSFKNSKFIRVCMH
jgi:hypothetical protein